MIRKRLNARQVDSHLVNIRLPGFALAAIGVCLLFDAFRKSDTALKFFCTLVLAFTATAFGLGMMWTSGAAKPKQKGRVARNGLSDEEIG